VEHLVFTVAVHVLEERFDQHHGMPRPEQLLPVFAEAVAPRVVSEPTKR
jgi:hypothetical protein